MTPGKRAPSMEMSDKPHAPRPVVPNLRWWIGGLLFASTVINYIDRQTLNVLAPYLKAEYHWTNSDFALIVIAFRISYAVVQLIGGRLVDVLGTRRGLGLAVAWYSVMAMLTSLASGLGSFCAFRFCWAPARRRTGPARPKPSPNGSQRRSVASPWRCSIAVRRSEEPWRRRSSCGSFACPAPGVPHF